MDELLAMAAARAITYLRGVDTQLVVPDADAVEGLGALVEALPVEGLDAGDVLDLLDRVGSPATVASAGGRYFGFVTGGTHRIGVASSWLASAWDQNAALGVMSPVAGVLDTVVGGWLTALLGLPRSAQHQFVTGTSGANALCLAVARDRLLADAGWDSVNAGLIGAPSLRIVVSDAAHSSVTKALGFVGLGRRNVVTVPSDAQGRMIAAELPEPGPPTIVITQAGNVNSGAFDPIGAVADHFAGSPHWIHVDGAFGLWAAATPSRRDLLSGVERAHSWATDLHKWLNTTYDSAVAIVAEREDMARTFQVGASYIPESTRLEPVDRGPDMSQRARAVEAYAVLAHLGSAGVAALGEQLCAHARHMATLLDAGGLVIDNDVVLNQVLVRMESDEDTRALVSAVQRSGELWCGGSRWRDREVMRISVSSRATTADDIEQSAAAIVELASVIRSG